MALYEHAFSWAFMISLPLLVIAIWKNDSSLYYPIFMSYVYNTLCHAYVDNLKANLHRINLIQDQLIHFGQIFLTWLFILII